MADDNEFLEAMRDVRPLRKNAVTPTAPARRVNLALRAQIQQRAIQSAALNEATENTPLNPAAGGQTNADDDTTLFFLRHGVQKKILRDLKKGQRYPVAKTVDLHGLTRQQAQAEIDKALQQGLPRHPACLLIIHGKGLHSQQGATLKAFTTAHLKSHPAVKVYCSAKLRDGGTGALYVLLYFKGDLKGTVPFNP